MVWMILKDVQLMNDDSLVILWGLYSFNWSGNYQMKYVYMIIIMMLNDDI